MSMHWNHRVLKDKDGYSIVEAFYSGKKIEGTTEALVGPYETLRELKTDLERMLKATDLPHID